ncbi:hypothetical protein [Weissella viridescens]|uniref:hypothetical protein n=2 Tax=Weissella viridescens TaxID=1629 RepID=UPI003AF1FBB4
MWFWIIIGLILVGYIVSIFKLAFAEMDREDKIVNHFRKNHDHIVDFDISLNGNHTERYSKTAGVLGAVAIGPIGLMAGSVFKKQKDTVNSIKLTIFFDDGSLSELELVGGEHKEDSKVIIGAKERIQAYANEIQGYIIENDQVKLNDYQNHL